MADITSAAPKKKSAFAKAPNRHSTKVDLTPMVDLGFLLITFFVLTTSMTEPRAMTLFETKEGNPQPVKQSAALTIILGEDHRIFYYFGILDAKQPANLKETDFKAVRSLILEKKKTTRLADLMYIIKAGQQSSFGDNVNLLDEMAICNIPNGHFAEVELTDSENELLASVSNREE